MDENKCKQFKSRVNTESIGEERPYKVYDGKCLKVCPADTEEFVDPVKHYHTCKVRGTIFFNRELASRRLLKLEFILLRHFIIVNIFPFTKTFDCIPILCM